MDLLTAATSLVVVVALGVDLQRLEGRPQVVEILALVAGRDTRRLDQVHPPVRGFVEGHAGLGSGLPPAQATQRLRDSLSSLPETDPVAIREDRVVPRTTPAM
jgi:hypothetical protein